MRKLTVSCFVVFSLLANPVIATEEWTGRVVGVADGDTLTVLHDGVAQKVRMAGIDCPEKSQGYGQKAKSFTSAQCFGKAVTVIERGHDRYGRTVADLILDSGLNLNQELVRLGLAWHYVQFSKDAALARLEAEARIGQRELWQDKSAIAPWTFRKQHKKMSKN